MNQNEYDDLIKIIVEEAESMLTEDGVEWKRHDEDEFHRVLFDRVMVRADDEGQPLCELDAREISEVCGEVESDIFHGDIIGLDRYLA